MLWSCGQSASLYNIDSDFPQRCIVRTEPVALEQAHQPRSNRVSAEHFLTGGRIGVAAILVGAHILQRMPSLVVHQRLVMRTAQRPLTLQQRTILIVGADRRTITIII